MYAKIIRVHKCALRSMLVISITATKFFWKIPSLVWSMKFIFHTSFVRFSNLWKTWILSSCSKFLNQRLFHIIFEIKISRLCLRYIIRVLELLYYLDIDTFSDSAESTTEEPNAPLNLLNQDEYSKTRQYDFDISDI